MNLQYDSDIDFNALSFSNDFSSEKEKISQISIDDLLDRELGKQLNSDSNQKENKEVKET